MASTEYTQTAGMTGETSTDNVQELADQAAASASAAAASETATAADLVQTNLDQIATTADALATANDAIATAADRVQTGLDAAATAADLVQTNLDQIATSADAAATAADRSAVAADLVLTDADTVATAADASAASDSAAAALASEIAAAASEANIAIGAIAETITATTVDVFVYDTSQDSDGGAWRKRTQNKSWYNETLNTATRGSRRDFPSVALIVVEAAKVTIYDADDPALPMWMVFNSSGSGTDFTFLVSGSLRAGAALNGWLALARNSLLVADFLGDRLAYTINGTNGDQEGANIAQRNEERGVSTGPNWLVGSQDIASSTCNDVAMTVESGAPIDAATGLAVPTIAVGTAGGMSIIKNTGVVYDQVYGTNIASKLSIADDRLTIVWASGLMMVTPLAAYTADYSNASASNHTANYGTFLYNDNGTIPELLCDPEDAAGVNTGGSLGLTLLDEDTTTKENGMVAYITDEFNTGWMHGDIKGAFLSSTDTASLVGGTDDDRSANANPLTVNGTVTRTAVATGAELVAYSGFSASNYLEQPYNADFNFGTGDFYVAGWFSSNGDTSVRSVIDTRGLANTAGIFIFTQNGDLNFRTRGGSINSDLTFTDGAPSEWQQFFCVRSATGTNQKIYIDGELAVEGTVTARNVNRAIGQASRIGQDSDGTATAWDGDLTLIRIGAGAPTAAQIKKAYEDEKYLFQENADAVLTNSTVEALAFDPDTNLLHVGGDVGRDEFQGLRRVGTTAGAVTSAISARNKLVATGKASTVDVSAPDISLREILNALR